MHPVLGQIPARIEAYIRSLEQRNAVLEARSVPTRPGSPKCEFANGQAVLGGGNFEKVYISADLYWPAWSKSTNAKDFILKLMSLAISEDVLATSNFFGGRFSTATHGPQSFHFKPTMFSEHW